MEKAVWTTLCFDLQDTARSPSAVARARAMPDFAKRWAAQQATWAAQLAETSAVRVPESDDEDGGGVMDPSPSFIKAASFDRSARTAYAGGAARHAFGMGPHGLGYYSNHEVISGVWLCSSAPNFALLRTGLLERGVVRPPVAPILSTGKELTLTKLLAFYAKCAPAKADATKLAAVLLKYRKDMKGSPIPADAPNGTMFAGHDMLRRKLAKKYSVEWSTQDDVLPTAPPRPTKPKQAAPAATAVAAAEAAPSAWAWTRGQAAAAPSTPPRAATGAASGFSAASFATPPPAGGSAGGSAGGFGFVSASADGAAPRGSSGVGAPLFSGFGSFAVAAGSAGASAASSGAPGGITARKGGAFSGADAFASFAGFGAS